jgi:ubiquinone/menaquinone biosynthesis C-methylase UbiE
MFDQNTSRRVDRIYQSPDVVAQRQEVIEALALAAGERVLDIGSGPGLLALEMAVKVGPKGRVLGVDLSSAMIELAKSRAGGHAHIGFEPGDALNLPAADGAFDVVVSTQVLEYVENVTGALQEIHRVLRRGGRTLILDTDYDSLVLNSLDTALTRRVLEAWDGHFVHAHLPQTLSRELKAAGFVIDRRAAVPMFNPEFEDDTYAKSLLDLMARFAAKRNAITEEEARRWLGDFATLGEQGTFFFSLNRYMFLASRPG